MKKLFLLIITTCVASSGAWAQTSSVSATITDSTSQAYANGTYDILFRPAPGVPGTPTRSGSAFTQHFSGVLDASGAFAVTLTRNDFIQPGGSQWTFTICPLAASACFTSNQTIAAASVNLTAALHTVTPLISVFSLGNIPAAYSSNEIVITPNPGSFFWNLTTGTFNFWNGASWTAMIVPTSNITFTGNNSFTGTNTFIDLITSSTPVVDVRAYGADATGVSDSTAAIQAAVNVAQNVGGAILIPTGNFLVTGTLTISKRITVRGEGWGSVLQIGAGVGSTTDIFLLKPATAADVQGMRFQDFYISPVSGTPGRSAFMVDGTNASVSNLVIDHVRVDTLGGYAFNIQNMTGTNSSVNGSPYLLKISNSSFAGGMNLNLVGDTVNIEGSIFTGVRDIIVNQIGAATTGGGAHGFRFVGNNVTVNGGSIIQNAWQGVWGWNDMESPNTSTEANSALLDIQGNASANVQDFQVIGNFLGATNTNVNIAVRVDKATNTIIRDNYMAQGGVSGATVTANAIRTNFVNNRHAPDNALSSWLADSGTVTWGMENDPTTGLMNFFGNSNSFASTAGTKGVVISATQVKVNPTNGLIAASSGDPSSTGADVSFSRLSAGQWSANTNAFNNSLGSIVQTGGIDLGTQQVRGALSITSAARILLSATAPTIATHFNTSGDSIATNGTASFTITVGTGAGTSTGVLTLPTAATGWNCWLTNQTRADQIQQTASSTTSATFTNFGTTFAATNWTNSDVLRGGCSAN